MVVSVNGDAAIKGPRMRRTQALLGPCFFLRRANPENPSRTNRPPEDERRCRVNMKAMMRISMRGCQPIGEHAINLRAEFRFDLVGSGLPAHQPSCHLRRWQKAPVSTNKGWDGTGRQHRTALAEVQMNSDVQCANVVTQALDGVFGRRLIHHQRGTGNNALQMAEQNPVRYAAAEAKIVGIDDDPFGTLALAESRSTRSAWRSTPERWLCRRR